MSRVLTRIAEACTSNTTPDADLGISRGPILPLTGSAVLLSPTAAECGVLKTPKWSKISMTDSSASVSFRRVASRHGRARQSNPHPMHRSMSPEVVPATPSPEQTPATSANYPCTPRCQHCPQETQQMWDSKTVFASAPAIRVRSL